MLGSGIVILEHTVSYFMNFILHIFSTALPTLLYGSENWTIKARDASKSYSSRDEIYEKNNGIHLDRS
jgi:hypothetical protein